MRVRSQEFLVAIVASILVAPASAQETAKPVPFKLCLIGDSIRLGYAPGVVQRLDGKAVIVSPSANGGDSKNVLAHLDEWIIREKPDVVHINCGLHDLKKFPDGHYQVELDAYVANLKQIVARIRAGTSATILFANTTPILDDRHAKRRAGFDRFEADVLRYNDSAKRVMAELGVVVNDLHGIVEAGGATTLLGNDGTHYTPAGSARLADAVVDCILRQHKIQSDRPLPKPQSGAEAAAVYRAAEAAGDRVVPEVYRRIKVPEFSIPTNSADWAARRPGVLDRVRQSLGDLPARPSPPRVRLIAREYRPGFVVESVRLDNGVDGEVSALLLLPDASQGPRPAILWLHSSTPDKTQILTPGTNGGAESLGEMWVKKGYAVLAPDAYWHGDRVGTGPAGRVETGRAEQESLLKFHMWFGRTLWGMFVRDDQTALDYLCTRPEVDRSRIGAIGMSMGSTRAWWLAAVDDRVAAVVGVACLTRYQNLIAHGQLRAHGVYYFVDGLLKHFDTEAVLALIAPRPYLALTGDLDAGSPADGIKILESIVGKTYRNLGAGDRFRNVLYPEVGHTFSPEMRREMNEWFDRYLRPTP